MNDVPDPMLDSPRPASSLNPDAASLRPKRRRLRAKPRFWALVAALGAVVAGTTWYFSRPGPTLLPSPSLTDADRQALLAAVFPGWPDKKPGFAGPMGSVGAVEGRIDGVAAADVDGDGAPEWGVAYTWLGPKDPSGARATQPGFAVVTGGSEPELLYQAPGTGGWDGPKESYYPDAAESSAQVEAVALGDDGLGFMMRFEASMRAGGQQGVGKARLFATRLGEWQLAWEGDTENRWSAGSSDETGRSSEVKLEDIDGDGHMEVLTVPSWYYRHLGAGGQGVHFTASGLGHLVHRLNSGRYVLSGLMGNDGAERKLRAAAPVLAVRASRPIVVDGRFDDWAASEVQAISGLRFDDPSLLKYKRRERHGLEDCSGDVRLLWDEHALYVRASIVDDTLAPGPPGRDLYLGDHLALWLDWDLPGDFRQDVRSDDDWQIGIRPGRRGEAAEVYCWVPKTGPQGIQAVSRPLVDDYSGGINGYELEAAIPWATLGGLPPGMRPGAAPAPVTAPHGQAKGYTLAVDGAIGFGAVLTDSDTKPQELVYVSNPGFTWAAPRSFNTLLLVEPRGSK